MKKETKRLLGSLAIVAGALGATAALLKKKSVVKPIPHKVEGNPGDVWARPGMLVTFRAELMPGREREERTFRVKELLSSGRASLQDVDGEHAEKEFEPVQFDRRVE